MARYGRNKQRKATRDGKPTHSIYRGVTREKGNRLKPWKAVINTGGRQRNLGRFEREIDAAFCYADALLTNPL